MTTGATDCRSPGPKRAGACLAFILALLAMAGPLRAMPGDLDPTFGTGGKVTTDFPGPVGGDARAVALQPDGKLVAAGIAPGDGGNGDFALLRHNADGSVDPTFGTDGRVTTDFGIAYDRVNALVVQPDGRIVAVGEAFTGSGTGFGLARYNPDGSLDPTFGAGGKVTTGFGYSSEEAFGVALQPDGKLVAVGMAAGGLFALARYNPNGTLDPSFGAGGKVTTSFAGDGAGAQAVALQPDGKLVAAGFVFSTRVEPLTGQEITDGAFALARYNSDGSPDPSFGAGGKLTTDFASDDDRAFAVAIQADGKLVAAGFASSVAPTRFGIADHDFALARYNPDGSLDPTFGLAGSGKVTTDFFAGSYDLALAVALQPDDGKLIAVGQCLGDGGPGDCFQDFAIARYNPDGTLDTTFGTAGKVTTDFGLAALAFAAVLQPDGKLVAAGEDGGFALARYNRDGSLDPTFGTGGEVSTEFIGNRWNEARAAALQPDGKLVAVGFASSQGDNVDFALARYNPAGSLDPTFGAGGRVITDFAGDRDQAFAVALQPDGKLVAVGSTYSSETGDDFALARYNPDGSLDPTFGSGGKVTTDFGWFEVAFAVVLQPDGKLVAAGGEGMQDAEFKLARYNPDGSLDPTFGSGGKVTTEFCGTCIAQAFAVTVQPDGKIVAAGFESSGIGRDDFALVRYNPDGSLDPTFGESGKVMTDFDNDVDHASAVTLQPDGKLVAVGFAVPLDGVYHFGLARYNADGSLDPTFGAGGKVMTGFGDGIPGQLDAAALQPDGRIVGVGGVNGRDEGGFGLARYNPDGSLDPMFGTAGAVITDFGGNRGFAFAAALQPDGKLVAVGAANNDFALARYEGGGTTPTTATATTTSSTTATSSSTTTATASSTTTTTTPPPCAATPRLGCQNSASGRGVVLLRNGTPDDGDQLRWKWTSSAATPKAAFGNPLTSSDYALCVYDDSGLKLGAAAPAGGTCAGRNCWSETTSGFKYKDRELTPDGLAQIVLRAGDAGRAKIGVKGRGANLHVPVFPLAPPVTVQLVRTDDGSACWEARFSSPSRNGAGAFLGKSD